MPATAELLFKGAWTAPYGGWTLNSIEKSQGCWIVGGNNFENNSPDVMYKLVFDLGAHKCSAATYWNAGKPNWKPIQTTVAQGLFTALTEWQKHSEGGGTPESAAAVVMPPLPHKVKGNPHVLLLAEQTDPDLWYIKTIKISKETGWETLTPSSASTHSATFHTGDGFDAPKWKGGKNTKFSPSWFDFGKGDTAVPDMWGVFLDWHGDPVKSTLPFKHEDFTVTEYAYNGEVWKIGGTHAVHGAMDFKFKPGQAFNDEVYVQGILGQGTWLAAWLSFKIDSPMAEVWYAGQAYMDSLKSGEEPTIDDLVEAAKAVEASDFNKIAKASGITQKAMTQVRCFAAFHDMTTVAAWKAVGFTQKHGPCKVPNDDMPDITDFDVVDWTTLRATAAEAEHSVTPHGPCTICLAEAEKNGGDLPDKLKMFVSFINDESTLGLKADLEEAKALRRQISAFAFLHGWNRYTAVEKIKEAGPKAAYLLPYLFPAEKDAAPPDYYKLKTHTYFDIAVALQDSDFNCTCQNCKKAKQYIASFEKGQNVSNLEFPDHIAKYEKAKPKAPGAEELLAMLPEPKKYTLITKGPAKDSEVLIGSLDFAVELSAFAAYHELNRWEAAQQLPENWKSKFADYISHWSEKAPKVKGALYVDKAFPHVALAVGCQCVACKHQIKALPKLVKKAVVKKKQTKKAVTNMEAAFSQALGEGIMPVEASAPPLEDQITAYAAYHGLLEWAVAQNAFPGNLNLYSKHDPTPSIGDLVFHVWPDLLDCEGLDTDCEECEKQKNGEMADPTPFDKITTEDEMQTTLTKDAETKAPAKMQTVSVKPGDQIVLSATEEFQMQIPEDQQFSVIPKS